MVDQRLVDYIRSQLLKGFSLGQIRQLLLSKGWHDSQINEAVNLIKTHSAEESKPAAGKERAKKSQKVWIILVLAVIIVTGSISMFFMFSEKEINPETKKLDSTPAEVPAKNLEVIDCGTDLDCLISASKNCEPAKVTFNKTINTLGMLTTTAQFYEIKGMEGVNCILYLRLEKQEMDFSEELIQKMLAGGATPAEIEQKKQESNRLSKSFEGKDGICKFNDNANLASLLNKWKAGSFSEGISCKLLPDGEQECIRTGDWEVADCEGERFTFKVGKQD